MNHHKQKIAFLIIFLLSSCIAILLTYQNFESKRDAYYTRLQSELKTAYEVITFANQEIARIFFETHINQPEILELYKQAVYSDEEVRNTVRRQLLKNFSSLYEKLKLRDVKQFHFHLPNSVSFLRFHRPEKYGDNLKGIRPSVEKANKELVAVSGFEEGCIYNGFRNVFPLIYNGEHLGSVEISMDFDAIRKQMEKQFSNRYALLVRRQVIENKVFEEEQINYKPSDLSEDFLYERDFDVDDTIKAINKLLKSKIQERLRAGESFAVEAKEFDVARIVIFFPVKNIQGQHLAYIVSHKDDATVNNYYSEFIASIVVMIILIFVIVLLIYILTNTLSHTRIIKERLELALKGAELGMWDWNVPSGKFLFNERWAEILGYTPEKIKPNLKSWEKLIHPDDKETVMDILNACLEGRTNDFKAEYRLRSKSGEWKWILSIGKVFERDKDGKPVRMLGIHQDITERKRVEDALKKRETRMYNLFNAMQDIVFEMDYNGTFLNIAPTSSQFLILPADKLTGKTLHDVFPKEQADTFLQFIQKCIEENKADKIIYPLNFSGETIWFEGRANPIGNKRVLYIATDITERKRAEENLEAKERFLQTIFDGIQAPMHVIDRNFKILLTNKKLLELKNVKQEDIRGKYCYEVYQGRNELCEQCGAKGVFETGEPVYLIKYLPLPDGTYRYFEVYAFPLKEENGEVTQAIELTYDITERKRAEELLKQRDAILSAVAFTAEKLTRFSNFDQSVNEALEHLGKASNVSRIYIFENHIDEQGVLLTSQRYEWVASGITPQIDNPELQNLPLIESGFGRWVETLSKNEIIYGLIRDFPETEQEILKAHDIKSIVVVPIFVIGQWWGFIGFDECLTEKQWSKVEMEALKSAADVYGAVIHRKQVEKQLYNEREKLLVTLWSIGDAVITTDIEGRVTFINRIAEELTGWKQQEAFGKILTEVFHIINEKSGEPVENPVKKVLDSGIIVGLANHTALISRDGHQFSIADSGAPIRDSQGKVIGVVLVFRDVTEEKKREQEQLKIEKLQSVGVLAGGIAHDFNNILLAILGNINLADNFIGKEHKAHSLLKEAEKASLRAKDLTQQLLTFAKGGEPVKKTASIAQIIIDSANFVLHGSKVICSYDIPDNLWLVEIDTGQMSQVIQNLVINARQAMPEGGEIKISCENITEISKETALNLPGEKWIKITIADQGCGIPEKYIDKIFDPYFTTKQQGSGFGLAITHSIIKKHHGHISVRSKHGEGTTFMIYLPALDKQKFTDVEKETLKTKKIESATILVMDDEEMIRELAEEVLSIMGHKTLLAKDGKEAIDIFREYRSGNKRIDLIIMDLTIPSGMGGKDVIKEILKIDPEAKAIVSSGYSNDPVMTNFREYGFKASIVKPFKMAEFEKLINSILG